LRHNELGLEAVISEIRRAEDIAPAIEALQGFAEALYVAGDPLVTTNRNRLGILAVGARLPTMHGNRENVDAGASYPMDQTFRICIGAPPTSSTRFCEGRRRRRFQSSSRPKSIGWAPLLLPAPVTGHQADARVSADG
jgi:hypothetical protein